MDLKGLKNQLLSKYKYQIELHAHTSPASSCSQITPKEMVDTYKKLGYDAVVISNHFMYQNDESKKQDYIKAFLNDFEQTKRYGDKAGLKIYLGAEIRFTEFYNDYLIFGINEKMLFEIHDLLPFGVESFRKNYSMPNSVFIQAHPFRDNIKMVDAALVDGFEVYNMHPEHNSRVGIASIYANEKNISIITAGSDFHHPNKKHEGLSALRAAYLPENSFDLAKILKSGDYLLELGRSNIIVP